MLYRKDLDRHYKKIWPSSLILDVEETKEIQSKYQGNHNLSDVFQIVTHLDRLGGIDKLVVRNEEKELYGISERIRNSEFAHFRQLTLRPTELEREFLAYHSHNLIRANYFAYGAKHSNNQEWAYLYIVNMDKLMDWAIGKGSVLNRLDWAHSPKFIEKTNDPFWAWDFDVMPKDLFLMEYNHIDIVL